MPESQTAAVPGGTPTPYLDHVVVMLDGEAYRDVVASGFLREELGRFKVKEAVSSFAGTYTSVGVAGVNTLVQIFDVAMPSMPGRTGGLVFSFQEPGSVDGARRRLEARGATPVRYELVRRAMPGESKEEALPAYHMLEAGLGEESPLLLMLDEATPEFFDRLGARRGPAGELYRSTYLDAVLGSAPSPHHYFRDITEVAVRLRADRAERLAATLETLGYAVETAPGGKVLRGPEVAVHLVVDDDAPEGILWMRLSLTRPADGVGVQRFGTTSTLAFEEGGTALWSFTPPHPAALAGAAASGSEPRQD